MIYCQIQIADCLRLNTLRGINQQQRTFTGRDRAAHFVGEVNVTGRINEIEDVLFPVGGVYISHLDSMALDGDATLALQIHIIQGLILHLAFADGIGIFQQPVGKCAFAVVNVGDDTKIANVLHTKDGMSRGLYLRAQR